MSLEIILIISLLAIVAMQQVHIHVLINKISSRNYYEYQLAEKVGKPAKKQPIRVEQDLEEDIGHIL